ncbi:hypothetical protein ACFE04_007017 [Oxalis oulophora]
MNGIQLPQTSYDTGTFDDDGRVTRTGTWITASAHIITAVIGSGVLSLAWAVAQLGWIAGPVVLLSFAGITYMTSAMLCDCYRAPDPITGQRNYIYMDAVKAYLGERKVKLCGIAQYTNLVGAVIGYTITSSISMVAVVRSNCFHKHGHDFDCNTSNYTFMAIFAAIQIFLCQIPNFHKLSWLSTIAAIMSFMYAFIGIGLSIAKVAGAHVADDIPVTTTLTGTVIGIDVTASQKVLKTFQALGNIAFAYTYSVVIIEIQVFCQPIHAFVEEKCHKRWPDSKLITKEYAIKVPFIGTFPLNLLRIVWRTSYVLVTALVAMIFPFFNDFLGLIGAVSFWPLTVYFPTEMHIAQTKMRKKSIKWIMLKVLSGVCLLVSILAAIGSIEGLIAGVRAYKPFKKLQ